MVAFEESVIYDQFMAKMMIKDCLLIFVKNTTWKHHSPVIGQRMDLPVEEERLPNTHVWSKADVPFHQRYPGDLDLLDFGY